MISRKLLEVLTHFSKEEQHRLVLFVRSPYHNNGHNAATLANLLEQLLTSLEQGQRHNLEKKHLNQLYFPDSEYLENKKNPIDALASKLFQLIKEFIFIEEKPLSNKAGNLLALAKFYRKNSIEGRFRLTVNQLRKYLEKQKQRGAAYYMDCFLLEEEVSVFETTFNTYTGDSNLLAAHEHLDRFYSIIKLEFSAALQFQKNLGQIDTRQTLRLSQAILDCYDQYEALQIPLTSLYKEILQMFQSFPSEPELAAFLAKTQKHEGNFPPVKFRNLMAFYRYFIIKQYRQKADGNELLQKIFALFKIHLEKGYFDVEEKILPQSLETTINIAILQGEISWAKKILKQYPPDRITGTHFPIEAHDLCLAEVLFAERNYDEAYEKLSYKKIENINYGILADVLLVKIYFMTENALLDSRVHALERKVRRSKLAQANQRQYLNFINVTKRIIKYKFDRQSKQWRKIQKDVTEITPLLERGWLKAITID